MKSVRLAFIHLALSNAWYFGLACGSYGFLLFVAGFLEEISNGWIPPKLAQFEADLSSGLTVLGTLFAVVSIYAPVNTRPPERYSKLYSAPIICAACVVTILFWVVDKKPNNHVFNGIAMLGMAIAILRLLSQKPRP